MSHWSLFAEALSAWALEAAALSLSLFVAVALLWKLIQRRASAHFGHLLSLVPLISPCPCGVCGVVLKSFEFESSTLTIVLQQIGVLNQREAKFML